MREFFVRVGPSVVKNHVADRCHRERVVMTEHFPRQIRDEDESWFARSALMSYMRVRCVWRIWGATAPIQGVAS